MYPVILEPSLTFVCTYHGNKLAPMTGVSSMQNNLCGCNCEKKVTFPPISRVEVNSFLEIVLFCHGCLSYEQNVAIF